MNIKKAKEFNSKIIAHCKEIKIARQNKELVPMKPIPELDIHQHEIDAIMKFTLENRVISRPYYPFPEDLVDFSGYKFWKMGYEKPGGFKGKDEDLIPIWILSAMTLIKFLKDSGVKTVGDLFAGDGRIQYCAGLNGMKNFGIEYSSLLFDVQKKISKKTNVELSTIQGDARKERDYKPLCQGKTAFFISTTHKEGETLNCLTSSLKKYSPEIFEDSLFVTFNLREGYHLKEKYSLILPSYWGLETFYHISELNHNRLKT